MKWFFFSIIFLVLGSTAYCQQLIFHKSGNREVFYRTGDRISFQLKGDDAKITERIVGFRDSLIVFPYYTVNPKEISYLYVDSKTRAWHPLRYSYKRVLPTAGIGYFFIYLINGGKPGKETYIVSGSLVGAGVLAKYLVSDKISVGGDRKLLIID